MVELPPSRLAKHSQTPDEYASGTNATSTGLSIFSRYIDKSHGLQSGSGRQNRAFAERTISRLQSLDVLWGRELLEGMSNAMVLSWLAAAKESSQSDAYTAISGSTHTHFLSTVHFRDILVYFGWRGLTRSEHAPSASIFTLTELPFYAEI